MKKFILFTIAFFSILFTGNAKIKDILPTPKKIEITYNNSFFQLGRKMRLSDTTDNPLLKAFAMQHGGISNSPQAPLISVEMTDRIEGAYDYPLYGYENEAYILKIEQDKINIHAVSPVGVTRAVQTLNQLAESDKPDHRLELVRITDWPAFKLRGFMHDVGRSFISIDELKKEIDLLSRFKINTFHFHLTENQAWRFEVKKYPKLTSAASMTRFEGQFYTQQECRELEQFAAEHGVVIIPEIDMPGHSQAFERALGYSMQTDRGVETLKEIIDEVIATFPLAPYIHIGADEQTITYPDFLKIMTDKIHAAGKKIVVWNPIRGVKIRKEAGFDMTQMWSTAGRKVAGIPNIDCRYNYINHFDVYADVAGIYKSSIYYQQRGDAELAGAITAIWNDRKLAGEQDILRENNFYANALATGERAWKGGGDAYIEQGGTPLYCHTAAYREFADWERRFLFHKRHSLKSENIPYVRQCNVHWYITEPFPNEGDFNAVLPPEAEGPKTKYHYKGKDYGVIHATGAGIYLRHTWGGIVPSHFEDPQPGHTAYAWTYIYSPVTQQVGAQVEFQNYGRSEKDLAPANGRWDRKGSRLWVNDREITAPDWDNASKGNITNEDLLLNENFVSRPPVRLTLNKGWNKVFIKLPYVAAEGIRLNKWMFTFVVTDLSGQNEIKNILYEPGHGL